MNGPRHDGKPLFVLGYTDTARGLPQLDARKPNLHFVRFKDAAEIAEFEALLDAWNEQAA